MVHFRYTLYQFFGLFFVFNTEDGHLLLITVVEDTGHALDLDPIHLVSSYSYDFVYFL